jgi:hypothetical protein
VKVDLDNKEQTSAVLRLLNEYAMDGMGGGEPLPQYSTDNLIPELKKRRSTTHLFLAFVDETVPVGLANCFEGFSTFACKPLLNIHDFAVSVSSYIKVPSFPVSCTYKYKITASDLHDIILNHVATCSM